MHAGQQTAPWTNGLQDVWVATCVRMGSEASFQTGLFGQLLPVSQSIAGSLALCMLLLHSLSLNVVSPERVEPLRHCVQDDVGALPQCHSVCALCCVLSSLTDQKFGNMTTKISTRDSSQGSMWLSAY